jgi:hypothetical protein
MASKLSRMPNKWCGFDSGSLRQIIAATPSNPMDASLMEELIAKNKPFKIETASGRIFEVPHRDFVSFSTRKTSLIVSYEENGAEHFAIVPLLTITAAIARAWTRFDRLEKSTVA